MNARKHRCRKGTAWLLACSLLMLATAGGCVKAKKTTFLRYDAEADRFELLTVYSNIYVDNGRDEAKDYDYLAAMWWKQRGQIVPMPTPDVFGLPALLRLTGREYQLISLDRAAEVENERQTSSLPLNKIVVSPGEFHVGKAQTLGYYQRVTLPGEFVDATLAEANKNVREKLSGVVAKEQQRRTGGGARRSWEEVRRELVGQGSSLVALIAPADPTSSFLPADPILPILSAVDGESLGRLSKAVGDREAFLARQRGRVEWTVPLSADDCREAKRAYDEVQRALAKELSKTFSSSSSSSSSELLGEYFSLMLTAPTFETKHAGDGQRLVVVVDLGKLFDAWSGVSQLIAMDDAVRGANVRVGFLVEKYAKTIVAARDRGIPLGEGDSGDIVKSFLAGKLGGPEKALPRAERAKQPTEEELKNEAAKLLVVTKNLRSPSATFRIAVLKELIHSYPNTAAAVEAKQLIELDPAERRAEQERRDEEERRNEEKQRQVDAQANSELPLALSLKSTNSAAYKRRLQAIVDKYPNTKAATTAKDLLRE
jgi:hypothetical protein